MKENYFKSAVRIERLYRLFLEVIKVELNRLKIRDITHTQCLVLYNLGRAQVTVGELSSKGYYLGASASYNLRKMGQNGYLLQELNRHDHRSIHIKLSEKGLALYAKLDESFANHTNLLAHQGIDGQAVAKLHETLMKIEEFWTFLSTNDEE